MTRAKSAYERDLLRSARNSRKPNSGDGKVCGNVSCPEMGKVQPLGFFYLKNGKPESYCAVCRKSVNEMWRLSNPEYKRSAKPKSWNLNVGKAPWCQEHKKNSAKCGCATGVYHKTPAHKKAIGKAMRGNKNAAGKQGKRGPMSATHRAKISIAMRGRNKEIR